MAAMKPGAEPTPGATAEANRTTRGFLRENWFWILLPFLILGALVAWIALTSDLSQVFPWFYTPR